VDPAIVTDSFESSQAAVAARIEQTLDAAITKDLHRLASCHLDRPESTELEGVEPPDRQDAATSARPEAEQFTVDGSPHSGRTRSTVVFVEHEDQGLIAHEHHSPFVAGS
jgi:hypothetical protein